MGASELIRSLAVLSPIVGLLVVGLVICVQSGGVGRRSALDLRRMAGNLSRALLVLGACLLGLAAIQVLVGFPLDGLG